MTNSSFTRLSTSRLERPLWKWMTPAHLSLLAIVVLSAFLHFYNLRAIGDANLYYTAAVKSMLQSWHNFFFVAAEPGGSVMVDKPPLGLWLEAAFAAVLGVSGVSTSLPNILAGLLSIPLLYYLVKRCLGVLAGLMAALVFALTPTVLATNRNNTMDGMLVFFLLLAAWMFLEATESGRLRWLLLGAFWMGLAFNVKMLQAFLPLPAFYALYLVSAPQKVGEKLRHLGVATLLLLAISLSWALAVDLTPASARPYVGSSQNNTVVELIVGHNGLERLLGSWRNQGNPPALVRDNPSGLDATSIGPQPPPEAAEACRGLVSGSDCLVTLPQGGIVHGTCAQVGDLLACIPSQVTQPQASDGTLPPHPVNPPNRGMFVQEIGLPSPVRLFVPPLAKEVSWLLPFGLVCLVLLVLNARFARPLVPEHRLSLLWGGWLLVGVVFFSMANLFHAYYLVMLAAPLGALIGGGVHILWRSRHHGWAQGVLALGSVGTLAYEWRLAQQYGQEAWWMPLAAVLLVAGLTALLLGRYVATALLLPTAYGLLIAALLIIPMAWSILTVAEQRPDVNLPSAYGGQSVGARSAFPGQISSPGPGQPSLVDAALIAYLQANTQGMKYLVAVPSAQSGAPLVLATGRPVLYLGGFSGGDPVVDSTGLEEMVTAGELRFILFGERSLRLEIARWVERHCTPLTRFRQGERMLYDCQERR
ncbi:MAG: glycosyltransferase family 39 protein [Anaerolineales bacterium]|nr:glycosyltransferase family 39 protein [Anaerolineales bacterium]